MPTEFTPIGKEFFRGMHLADVYQLLRMKCVASKAAITPFVCFLSLNYGVVEKFYFASLCVVVGEQILQTKVI